MFGRSVTLFRMFGFAVRVDSSWLVIAVLITWSLAVGFFPHTYPGLTSAEYWLMGVSGAILLFVSIIVHELAHSIVARKHGLPMKGITLFIFGGVAEMDQEPPSAKAEFLMAIAGPLTSIVVGAIFYILAAVTRGSWPVVAVGVFAYLAWINWILAAFNMVPAFPLDGGRVLRSLLWQWKNNIWQATRIAAAIGSGFGMLLMAFGVYRLLIGDFIGAVWWFLIGMFLRGAAQGSYQQLLVQRILQGEPIRRFMNTSPVTVSPAISLEDLVENYIYRYHYKMFPVVNEANELLGCVTTREVRNVPRSEWAQNSVQAVMRAYCDDDTVTPDTDAIKALAKMRKSQNSRLMVVQDGHLLGVLTLKDLLDFLTTKLEMESGTSELPSAFRL
ncbi:MAG TPA: site-2 protease family protein [Terriglobia bacterium]|jgi:Zn-dependent protease/predicted transcriptional regulator|nr:site-2 protease family protein [Terriglobia bacterium]